MRSTGLAEAGQESDGLVTQVQQQVQVTAQDIKGQASRKAKDQIDSRSTDLGEQARSLGKALHQTAEQLEREGQGGPAGVARQAAGQIDRLGGYLKNSSSDRFLNDLESFARSKPWAAGGLGALVGLVASRFLKASSGQRYASSQRPAGQALPPAVERSTS
jgi:hypothetical protein